MKEGTERSDAGRGRQRTLVLSNSQRAYRVDLRLFRRIVRALLREAGCDAGYDLAIPLVARPEITRLNEKFLQHKGSTDVITFDYGEEDKERASPGRLHGEIFVCLEEAVRQAGRFRSTWQSELVRYAVHGVLHLLGYDDREGRARRRMKRAEDLLVRRLAGQFDFRGLGKRKGTT